jgi:hypothetical protein
MIAKLVLYEILTVKVIVNKLTFLHYSIDVNFEL